MFNKGDFVKDSKGNVGKVTSTNGNGVYIFGATAGQNGYFSNPQPATKEEYDAQIEARMHPQKVVAKSITSPASKLVVQQTKKQWLCLGCGNTFNGRICPLCDSDEKIYNVDMRARGA